MNKLVQAGLAVGGAALALFAGEKFTSKKKDENNSTDTGATAAISTSETVTIVPAETTEVKTDET